MDHDFGWKGEVVDLVAKFEREVGVAEPVDPAGDGAVRRGHVCDCGRDAELGVVVNLVCKNLTRWNDDVEFSGCFNRKQWCR